MKKIRLTIIEAEGADVQHLLDIIAKGGHLDAAQARTLIKAPMAAFEGAALPKRPTKLPARGGYAVKEAPKVWTCPEERDAAIRDLLREGRVQNADGFFQPHPAWRPATKRAVYSPFSGQSYLMIKRHFRSDHGLSIEQVRDLFNINTRHLPTRAAGYAATKSAYAKAQGLGTVPVKLGKKCPKKLVLRRLAAAS